MQVFLSRAEFAERIGVLSATLSRYALPEPDAVIGTTRGWTAETIDAWNEARPGKGAGAGRKRTVPENVEALVRRSVSDRSAVVDLHWEPKTEYLWVSHAEHSAGDQYVASTAMDENDKQIAYRVAAVVSWSLPGDPDRYEVEEAVPWIYGEPPA